MNINDELYERIDKYLSGSLSQEESSQFEKMMEDNADLKTQTEKVRRINELLFMEGLKLEIPEIKKAESNYLFKQQLKQYGKWFGWSSMIIGGSILIYLNYTPTPDKTSNRKLNNTLVDTTIVTIKNNETFIAKETTKNTNANSTASINDETKSIAFNNQVKNDSLVRPTVVVNVKQDSISIQKPIIQKSLTIPCKEAITGEFETKASCEEKNDGSIVLKSIRGGTKPYKVSFNNGKFQEENSFYFLSSGNYQFTIQDLNACNSIPHTIVVEEKKCIEKSPSDYVFSYQTTIEWAFPEVQEKEYSFLLFDISGRIVYSTAITNGYPSSWNGYSLNNQKLPLGLYNFRFVQADKILQQGTITILD